MQNQLAKQLPDSLTTIGKGDVIWEPQPGSQEFFLSCPIYETLYDGTRGPGKTDALLMDYAQHVGVGYGEAWRGILFRNTYKQLADIVARSKKWFFQIFPGSKFNESDYVWKFPTGEQLLFRYMNNADDYWNYHGHEYPWIGWEELTNWPTIDCYDSMHACCRSSHPGMPRKYRATSNPYGKGHSWVKRHLVDIGPPGTVATDDEGNKRVRIHGVITENKILLEMDPEYVQRILSTKDPNKRKAWVEGSWDIVAGGAIDDLWYEDVHMIHPFDLPRHWKYDRSFDWGASKPFSVGWWAESDGSDIKLRDGRVRSFPPKTVFRIAEYYGWNGNPNEGCRMSAPNIAKKIKEIESHFNFVVQPGPADSSIYDAGTGLSIADEMGQQGVRWVKANKGPGSRVTGLSALRTRLEASCETPMEEPGIFIFDTCAHFKRTVPVLPRDTKKPDDVDCFVAGTLILTPAGDTPIELLRVGDFVSTPIGPRRLLKTGVAGKSKTIKIVLSNGEILQGTVDHKVYVKNVGLMPLGRLSLKDQLLTKEEILCLKLLPWNTKALNLESILTENIWNVGRLGRNTSEVRYFIESSGRKTMARFPKGSSSIIKSMTHLKMRLMILNLWLRKIMLDTTTKDELKTVTILGRLNYVGLEVSKAKQLLEKILPLAVTILPYENLRALIVANLLRQDIQAKNSVLMHVRKQKLENLNYVRSVEMSFEQKQPPPEKCRPVVINVVGGLEKETSVYYLTVEQAHLFFANGVLSANTDSEDHIYDETRYRLTARVSTVTQVEVNTHG